MRNINILAFHPEDIYPVDRPKTKEKRETALIFG